MSLLLDVASLHERWRILDIPFVLEFACTPYGAFTLDVKSVLNENLGGIIDGTQC
jgi:hypothetical protein